MPEYKKVMIAGGISVLVHVSLFTALALMPADVRTEVRELPREQPLEVTMMEAVEAASEINPVSAQEANVIRTQLDPLNLKKAEKPPENPAEIAAYNSQAAPLNQAAMPESRPQPTPASDSNDLALAPTAVPVPTPAPEKKDEIGIDALGDYSKAIGDIVGNPWYEYTKNHALPLGQACIQFEINAEGGVVNIRLLSNTGETENAAAAIRILKEVKFPAEILNKVPVGRKIEFTFTSF